MVLPCLICANQKLVSKLDHGGRKTVEGLEVGRVAGKGEGEGRDEVSSPPNLDMHISDVCVLMWRLWWLLGREERRAGALRGDGEDSESG